jgi:streptomycin 6-kinase
MQLPDTFTTTIRGVFKRDGEKFLAALPDLINEASHRWGLTDIHPVPNLSYNFVAFAKRGKEDVVFKAGVPNRELTSEMSALKLFNGNGACQLLGSDEERGLLLLERLNPGKMLAELEDDDERTHIAAELILNMMAGRGGGTPPLHDKFIKLSDWFDGLKKIRPHFNGGTGPFPKELLERVESFLPELFFVGARHAAPLLLHGDFHHYNILSSDRGWLVIDPKGVIGPVGYEIGPLMTNPWNSFYDRNGPALSSIERFKVQTERRISILMERLGWERETIIKWSTAHSVLSAWWSIEDSEDWKYALKCAEIFSELK